jgi:hypothetical protein
MRKNSLCAELKMAREMESRSEAGSPRADKANTGKEKNNGSVRELPRRLQRNAARLMAAEARFKRSWKCAF